MTKNSKVPLSPLSVPPSVLHYLLAENLRCHQVNHEVIQVAPGCFRIRPKHPLVPTHKVVLSCGVHGDETAPIEMMARLLDALCSGLLEPQAEVLIVFANASAILLGARFVELNMNRLFAIASDSASKDIPLDEVGEQARAGELMAVVDDFFNTTSVAGHSELGQHWHWDLHTAIRPSYHETFAVLPFDYMQGYSRSSVEALAAMGINDFLLSHAPTQTFSHYSSLKHHAHAATVELGRVTPFHTPWSEQIERFYNQLCQWIALGTSAVRQNELTVGKNNRMHYYQVTQEITRQHHEFRFMFDEDTANFTPFGKGQVLAVDGELRYEAQHAGEVVIFPNAKVAIGQRAALTAFPIEYERVRWQ